MNIGLNITQNTKNFNSYLNRIKIRTKDYKECNFIDVSSDLKLHKNIKKLDVLLTYKINQPLFKKSSNRGGSKYINKTPNDKIVKTPISLLVTTLPSSLAF